MRNLFRAFALFVLLISVPVVTSAATAAELAAQAEALLQQIAALQAQLAAQTGGQVVSGTTVTGAACPNIGRVLKLGSTGDDVARLQTYLASGPSVYPEALVSGYYGSLTEAAVRRWQTKYNIVSSGSPESTGFGVTGPRTAAAIALHCTPGGSAVGPAGSVGTPSVGGFIQVTPVAGNAPLTVSVTATVNTVASCNGTTYVLDWGDGTIAQNIQVPAGSCSQLQQTFSHIYLYGGTYLVRLSAGQHSTSATVIVSGTGSPVIITGGGTSGTVTTALSFSSPSSGQSIRAGDPIGISWTSQNAPSGAKVRLELYKTSENITAGNNDHGLNASTSELPVSGSYSWTTPSGGAVLADAGHSGFVLAPGTYRFVGKLYTGSACWGFCSGNNTRTTYATAESNSFTVAQPPFEYGPLAVTPNVSNNPLAVAASFNIPTACTGYTLNWGDGTTSTIQSHGTSCADSAVTRIFTHEYSGPGSYVITLKRGADLSRIDTAAITISN